MEIAGAVGLYQVYGNKSPICACHQVNPLIHIKRLPESHLTLPPIGFFRHVYIYFDQICVKLLRSQWDDMLCKLCITATVQIELLHDIVYEFLSRSVSHQLRMVVLGTAG